MKICERHTKMIPKDQDFNIVYQKFAAAMKVFEHQEKIEARRNHCMVCAFGRDGSAALLEIINPKPKKEPVVEKL